MSDSQERLWVYVTEYPDGTVGTIAAFVPAFGFSSVLVARSREAVEKIFGPIARAHGEKTGQRVWLREYKTEREHGQVWPENAQ